MRAPSSATICQSGQALPSGSIALFTFWMRRSVLLKVPSFSAKLTPGSTTSANATVSVGKMSCTTRNSHCSSAACTWWRSGSDTIGFSPMMYSALTVPWWAALTMSATVSPTFIGAVAPHACSNLVWTASIVTAW